MPEIRASNNRYNRVDQFLACQSFGGAENSLLRRGLLSAAAPRLQILKYFLIFVPAGREKQSVVPSFLGRKNLPVSPQGGFTRGHLAEEQCLGRSAKVVAHQKRRSAATEVVDLAGLVEFSAARTPEVSNKGHGLGSLTIAADSVNDVSIGDRRLVIGDC